MNKSILSENMTEDRLFSSKYKNLSIIFTMQSKRKLIHQFPHKIVQNYVQSLLKG
jgi:hypothetical protein